MSRVVVLVYQIFMSLQTLVYQIFMSFNGISTWLELLMFHGWIFYWNFNQALHVTTYAIMLSIALSFQYAIKMAINFSLLVFGKQTKTPRLLKRLQLSVILGSVNMLLALSHHLSFSRYGMLFLRVIVMAPYQMYALFVLVW